MSGTKPSQSRAGESLDADGYHVEERAESEEYHQTKEVREDEGRTEIHVREGKVVKLEEVKTKETIRLASDEEVRALTFADFEGLDEIEAGMEVTVEEYSRKESRHEKTVHGEPIIEISLLEERKSEEVKEDPQWKKDRSLFLESENGKYMNTSLEFGGDSVTEIFAVSGQAPSFTAPAVKMASTSGTMTSSASGLADADASILRDPHDAELETSFHGKSKRTNGLFGKKSGKANIKGSENVGGAFDMEMETTNSVDKEHDVHDLSASRRHEVKHKRHIIEEVVIEDSDKFYEKQEKRPKLFLKGGTLERKKESPLETSHKTSTLETGSVKLRPPNESLHAESLPNISAENVTYVVDYNQQASGSIDLEGHGDKPLSENKWYSFPRKRVTENTPASASASLQKQPKAKGQEEVIIFDGQQMDKTERKWGLKFGTYTGQTMTSIPKTVSTEQVTYVVENESPAASASTVNASAETHASAVKGEHMNPNISGLPHSEKGNVRGKHDVKANVEPQTVTFVVEQDLPEKDGSLRKDKQHSLGLFGKTGGLSHEKDTSKTSLDSETVTYVVQTDFPKVEVELEKNKDVSLGLPGNLGAYNQDKAPESLTFVVEQDMPQTKVELPKGNDNLGSKVGAQMPGKHVSKPNAQLETVTFVVEQKMPQATVEKSKGKDYVGKEPESLTFVVEQDMPQAKVELNKGKDDLGSKVGVQLPEKHASKPSSQFETVKFVVEQDMPQAKVGLSKGKEHSGSKAGGQLSEKYTNKPSGQPETIRFVVEEDIPKLKTEPNKGKEHSLGKVGGQFPETNIKMPGIESETVTFVVEQELPKSGEELKTDKERSWGLPGRIGGQHSEKDTDKWNVDSETITFVVEQDLPKAEVKVDKEKEHSWHLTGGSGKEISKPDDSQEKVIFGVRPTQKEILVDESHYYSEKNPTGKKGEAELQMKGSLPAVENLTITVHGKEDPGKVSLSGDNEKGKKSWKSGEKKEKKEKKRKFQDEVIIDDAHLHMDEGKIKVKQGFGKLDKDRARTEIGAHAEGYDRNVPLEVSIKQPQGTAANISTPKKPEKQNFQGEESVTFIIEENLPEGKLELEDKKSGSRDQHGRIHSGKPIVNEDLQPKVITFVVEQDLSPKTKVEPAKDKTHSWSLTGKTGGHLPKKDKQKPSAEAETVTFVVEQDLPKADVKLDMEKEHSWSLTGKAGGHLPEKVKQKPSAETETVTFVIEQDLPKADVKLDMEKEHSWSLTGKAGGHLPKKDKQKPSAEAEAVTFVVEQDLPKADVKLDMEKEHSWSFPGIVGSQRKDTSKPDIGPETVTFIVEQDMPKIEIDRGKEKLVAAGPSGKIQDSLPEKHKSKTISQPQAETVTFIIEQDEPEVQVQLDKAKEHSKNLSGKFGSLFAEKTSSKTSLEPESVTFVVEEQPIAGVEGSISVGKPEISGDWKKHKQEERIVDDTHLYTDESDIKLKAPRVTDIVRKKELKTPTQVESITFVVAGEPEISAELPTGSLTADGNEVRTTRPTQETVTYVVNEEWPTVPGTNTVIPDESARAEESWKLPEFSWPTLERNEDGDDRTHPGETATFVVQNVGPEYAAKRDDSQTGGHVSLDKTVELKPISGTISAGQKAKDTKQEEVIVDDTHMYSYKSELRWSPRIITSPKSKTGARPSSEAGPEIAQESVTYTVTTERTAPDHDSSSASDKGKGKKPHKWKVFGKKSSKGSEQSGSSLSLPSSSSSKETSLPRRQKQEERIVGSDNDYVPDNHGIITAGKRKPGAKKVKDGEPIDTTVYTFKVEPGLSAESVHSPKVPTIYEAKVADPKVAAESQIPTQLEAKVAVPNVHADMQASHRWGTAPSESESMTSKQAVQLKFDLGDVKSVENVKEEYLESPEAKKIVDPLRRTPQLDDRSKAEFQVNGFQQTKFTEHVEGSEVAEKRVVINFGTSTPRKDVSTGAHGDEVRGPGSSSPFDVTVTSDTSMSFVPQVRGSGSGYGGGLDGSFEGSSVTGSRPSSFYSVPAIASGSGPLPPQHFVVIAIDFGTTFSGYAFSFSRDISSIHVMRKWPDGDPGVVNMKTPTVLLLTPEGKFHSFGFTAKDFYHNLNPKDATKWLYFEKFKMALHYNADLSTGTELEASNGQPYPALSVFSHALRYFRDHALREVSDQSATRILNEDVRWVITVPAIWKAPAKQFMRQAAYQAGIASEDNPDQLLVALEPEAASVFIRKQRLQQLIPESESITERSVSPVSKRETTPEPTVLVDRVSHLYVKQDANRWSQTLPADALSLSFQRTPSPIYTQVRVGEDFDLAGMRYVVADCGGGTVDITVYELSAETGKLAELYKATGGPYGSMGVDLKFEALLVEIFGADFIDVFKAKRPAGWVDLMMAFESRKRAATPYKSKPLNVPLPFSFMDYHKKHKNSTVESALRKYGNKDVRWSSQGMMRLMPEAMDGLFQPTLTKIKEAINQVLSNPDVKDVKYIFLVGGFAESPMLQQELRNDFSHLVKVLIPADASLAILKGAVCFGCDPGVVTVRKSRMSYGLSVLNRFIRGRHPESKLAFKDGVEWCVDVFDPLVLANQSVALGSSVVRSYTPAGLGQKFGNFEMYCSERDDVQFITDEGVEKEVRGQLHLDLSQLDQNATGGKRREVQARLTFGDTEIKVVALDVSTGNSVRATIDFLNK